MTIIVKILHDLFIYNLIYYLCSNFSIKDVVKNQDDLFLNFHSTIVVYAHGNNTGYTLKLHLQFKY